MDMLFIGILTVTTPYVHGRSHELEHDDFNNFAVLHVLAHRTEKGIMMARAGRMRALPNIFQSPNMFPHNIYAGEANNSNARC